MTTIGTVESVWRYPVKGMAGESLVEGFLSFAGLYGDRVYALRSSDGEQGFPWHTAREQHELLLFRPRFNDPAALARPPDLAAAEKIGVKPEFGSDERFAVTVSTPEGKDYALDDASLLEHLRQRLNSPPDLALSFSARAHQDCYPLSVFSLQTLGQLARELDLAIDKRRFRANLYVDLGESVGGFHENTLVGKRLRLGEAAEIAIIEPDPRCKMISLDPDTGELNMDVLRHVGRAHQGNAGVYATVTREGMVRAGDPISLVESAQASAG